MVVNEHRVSELRLVVEKTAGGFEPGVLDTFTVEKAVSDWAAIEKTACAAKLRAAARAEEIGLDAEQAVAAASGMTGPQARRQTRLTKKLRDKHQTKAAFDDGKLSTTEAGAIADAVDADPEAEPSLLALASSGSTTDLIAECDRVRRDAYDKDGGLAAMQREARRLRHWNNALGNKCGTFEFEPVFGAKLVAELERRAEEKFRAQRKAGGQVDSQEQRMADALQDLVNERTGAAASKRQGPRTRLYLLADKAAVDRGRLEPGEKCETADGVPIPLRAVDEALSDPDTEVFAVIKAEHDIEKIVSYSRYWPARVVDAMIARGLVCEVPNCGGTKGLQKDHHYDYAKGGPTSAGNAGWKCWPCHDKKSRGIYDLWTDNNGIKHWDPVANIPPDKRSQAPPRRKKAS